MRSLGMLVQLHGHVHSYTASLIWPELHWYQVQTHDLRSSPAQYNFLMFCIYSMQYVKHISTKSSLYLMSCIHYVSMINIMIE